MTQFNRKYPSGAKKKEKVRKHEDWWKM